MNEIVISLGETVCQTGLGLVGFGNARCYDSSGMLSLGYVLIAIVLMLLIWAKLWSRAQ
jgi:hypothetical protein